MPTMRMVEPENSKNSLSTPYKKKRHPRNHIARVLRSAYRVARFAAGTLTRTLETPTEALIYLFIIFINFFSSFVHIHTSTMRHDGKLPAAKDERLCLNCESFDKQTAQELSK